MTSHRGKMSEKEVSALAARSWFLVEKPALALKPAVERWLSFGHRRVLLESA